MNKLVRELVEVGGLKKLLPAKDLGTHRHNGVGAFVPEIRKVDIYYDVPRHGAGGDSEGMVQFIQTCLVQMARERPYVEFSVQRRKQAPAELIAYYVNGGIKRHVCYRLSAAEILSQANYLCDTSALGAVPQTPNPPRLETVDKDGWPIRRRKNPRGSAKLQVTDLQAIGRTDWTKSFWKAVHGKDWKTVGRPTDIRYPWPIIKTSPSNDPNRPWDPFTAAERFRP
ncbi:hypothetical protein DFJ73DRAFT_832970 [Zopfochytrium polystomum]|nr:hypothetical protein DFJ73DRAFT_832970 [Zopfochytrium polystomum]